MNESASLKFFPNWMSALFRNHEVYVRKEFLIYEIWQYDFKRFLNDLTYSVYVEMEIKDYKVIKVFTL